MTRSRSVTIVAIIVLFQAVMNIVLVVPRLAQGTAGDSSPNSPPFAIALFVFTLAIFGLLTTYGLWKNAKWGKVLGLIVTALWILINMIPLLDGPLTYKFFAGGTIALNIICVVLLLRRDARPVTV